MFKKVILMLLSMSALAVEDTKPELTTTEKVVLFGGLGIGAVGVAIIAAPYVLSAGTIVTIKAGAAAVSTKLAAAGTAAKAAATALPVTTKVGVGLTVVHKVAQTVRPYIAPTEQENLAALKKQEAQDKQVAKDNYVACMKKNKFHTDIDSSGGPCTQARRMFFMMASSKELKNL